MLSSRAMKVYLSTLGCKLNESELESWTRGLSRDGAEIVADPRDADICVLNTCTVTHTAAHKSRQMARQLARANPNARIVLTGCFVDVSPLEAKKLPNVALIVPNADKDRLVERIEDFRFQTPALAGGARVSDFRALPYGAFQNLVSNLQPPTSNLQLPNSRTRAFVKIQDGCNMSCTYCIIPLARGKERSRTREEIVAEVQSLVSAGFKEIILTGVQISAYSNLAKVANLRKDSLRDLVAAILAETDVPRLRLTSIAPWDMDASLLELWRDARLCRHLHLSLQSGSDTVLRRMRRPYSTAQYARAAQLARESIPGVGITTDVIVGFPGESEVEFEQSLRFVEEIQFSRVHVFPYSARVGTLAATLPLPVSDAVKFARRAQMQAVADASARAFAAQFVGQTMPVLWESSEKAEGGRTLAPHASTGVKDELLHPSSLILHPSSVWSGYTDNYIRVLAASDADLHNQISLATVSTVSDDGVIANLV
jgi:threonylcarbamoyladenosine tRNA methylthiotransferase MtaB